MIPDSMTYHTQPIAGSGTSNFEEARIGDICRSVDNTNDYGYSEISIQLNLKYI